MEERLKPVMADVLHIPESSIGTRTSMNTVKTWDSAAHVTLMIAIEEEFDVLFTVEEIQAMLSFEAIVRCLSEKG